MSWLISELQAAAENSPHLEEADLFAAAASHIKALEAALKPFAGLEPIASDEDHFVRHYGVTVGSIRCARAVLSSTK